jgi:hypothetical protein
MGYHRAARRVQDVNPAGLSSPSRRFRRVVVENPLPLNLLAPGTAPACRRAIRQDRPLRAQPARQEISLHHDPRDTHTPLKAGRYLISPITRLLENGWYGCSVSIRSGAGQSTSDRVLRLTRLFRDRVAAADFATADALRWIGAVRPVPGLA